ncbi:YesL family protein [Sediminibacillus massiliensis]|uniref:YesL family protein n=1 Tax=Sediminibacillus massiliensis TaxID=1926277 RepID=UPI0015C2CD69|nr:YesL family protein [Sediminibacillus massiliensis]
MEYSGFLGVISRIVVFIVQLAYLNLLWILFSLLGLVFLGFAPATLAMCSVTRQWIKGDVDLPIFHTFWSSFRTEFIKSNIVFYILLLLGGMLYIYAHLIQTLSGLPYYLVSTIFVTGLVPYIILLLYIFPVMANYEKKVAGYLKYAILMGIASPLLTLLLGATIALLCIIFIIIPVTVPLFSGSLLSMAAMSLAMKTFRRVETKGKEIGSPG